MIIIVGVIAAVVEALCEHLGATDLAILACCLRLARRMVLRQQVFLLRFERVRDMLQQRVQCSKLGHVP